MSKDVTIFILFILMIVIILFISIFSMRENFLYFKKTISVERYEKEFVKKIDKKEKQINVARRKIIQRFNSNETFSETIIEPEDAPIYKKLVYYDKKNKKKGWKITGYILNSILIVILTILVSFSLYSVITKKAFMIGNQTFVTINSGSMSMKHENNSYLELNELDNQIPTYSLIGLKEVKEPSTIKQYGIYAYKDKEGKLICHRIIKSKIINGEIYYTFRGDANPGSDYYLIKANEILYEYTGYYNVPLGYMFSFLKSPFGLVTLVSTMIVLLTLDFYDSKKLKLYEIELNKYIQNLNNKELEKLN